MKTLSVQEPWAWAIVHGHKGVENRKWRTRYRGPLLIHAPAKIDPAGRELLAAAGVAVPPDEELPRSAIVGRVDLVDCVPYPGPGLEQSLLSGDLLADPLACGPFCWIVPAPRVLRDPIPAAGRLGLWDHPEPAETDYV